MQFGQYSHTGNFFKIGKIIPRNYVAPEDSLEIYNTYMYLSSTNIKYQRKTYDLLDLLGDLGGVTEVVMLLFGFFLFPLTEHSFTLVAA